MEAELRVTPQDLRTAATEFQGIHSQMTSLVEQMKDLVRNTSASWEGTAADAFRNKFNQLDDDMTRRKRPGSLWRPISSAGDWMRTSVAPSRSRHSASGNPAR